MGNIISTFVGMTGGRWPLCRAHCRRRPKERGERLDLREVFDRSASLPSTALLSVYNNVYGTNGLPRQILAPDDFTVTIRSSNLSHGHFGCTLLKYCKLDTCTHRFDPEIGTRSLFRQKVIVILLLSMKSSRCKINLST